MGFVFTTQNKSYGTVLGGNLQEERSQLNIRALHAQSHSKFKGVFVKRKVIQSGIQTLFTCKIQNNL